MNNWVEPGWNSKKTNYILSQGYKNYREPFANSGDATTLIETDANKLFDAYCGSEGTLNPAKSNTGYMELSGVYNITDGSPETKRAAVSDYIKNTYETATNVNLDINKGDSEGGRKTSFNKCFGVNINEVPTQSSYSGTVGSSLTAAPGITPQNISLSLLQYFFEQAGCSRTLNETDVAWWRGRANIQDIKNDMNAYGSLTANCSGDTRQHEFCKPDKCPSNKVIFYSQCNYGGRATELAEGEYPFNKLLATGYQNDTLQSVKVPQGMAVTMWEHDINGGREVTLDSDTPCLSSIGYMNTVSSCRIFKKSTNITQEYSDPRCNRKALVGVGKGEDVGAPNRIFVQDNNYQPTEYALGPKPVSGGFPPYPNGIGYELYDAQTGGNFLAKVTGYTLRQDSGPFHRYLSIILNLDRNINFSPLQTIYYQDPSCKACDTVNSPKVTNTTLGVTVSGPSCVNRGEYFTVTATGNIGFEFVGWVLEFGHTRTDNTGCKHPGGCGWYAPNTSGKMVIIHQHRHFDSRIYIDVI